MSDTNTIKVKFWGARGSYPTPGEETVRYGGNTACVELTLAGQTVILDAGTGIIRLGRDLLQRSIQAQRSVRATLLFSHMHHDHTQGFPFFAPAFIASTRLDIFGPHTFERDLEQVLTHTMAPPFFPVTLGEMSASKHIQALYESQVVLLGSDGTDPQVLNAGEEPGSGAEDLVRVRILRSYAHPGGVMVYRIEWHDKAVVYATDTEGYTNIDRRLVEFARGADLLIHDAQYTEEHYLGLKPGTRATQGWGHSTYSMACDVARTAGVKRLALFHYDPNYPDALIAKTESDARRLFPGTFTPHEGMEILLESSRAVRSRVSLPAAESRRLQPSAL